MRDYKTETKNDREVVIFTEEDVRKYLDSCIAHSRLELENGIEHAACYVDAYQSVRISIFGELLPL